MTIIEFLSAFGLGAIVTALIQAYLSHRSYISQRNFQEKKEAYTGLLDSFRLVLIKHNAENAKNVGYWQMRCNLVGSSEVNRTLKEIIEADKTTQPEKLEHLQNAMRKDLKVDFGV